MAISKHYFGRTHGYGDLNAQRLAAIRPNALLFGSRARMRTLTNSRVEPDFHGFSFSLPPWPFKQCYLCAPVVFSKVLKAHPDFRHFSDLHLAI